VAWQGSTTLAPSDRAAEHKAGPRSGRDGDRMPGVGIKTYLAIRLAVRPSHGAGLPPVTFLVALKQGLQATVRGMTDFPCHR